MSALAFLVAAVAMSAMGIAFLLVRRREPGGMTDTVGAFRREMSALDPSRRPPVDDNGRVRPHHSEGD